MSEAASKDNPRENQHFDLSEEASKCPGGEEATVAARQAENDDLNEDTNNGPANAPNDQDVENEVWTSSSGE